MVSPNAEAKKQKISTDLEAGYNATTVQAMENVQNRQNLSRPFSSVSELMEDLNTDD